MGLTARHEFVGDVLCLTFSGQFDLGTIPVIGDAFAKALVEAGSTLLVDLHDIAVPDDNALGILVASMTRARESGRELVVTCPPGAVADQLARFGVPLRQN